MATDHSALLMEYPEFISSDQLYQICHISKRKARWLLENGVIPCEDTGKKTRRFKIRTVDVIRYLDKLDQTPQKVSPPAGIFSSRDYQDKTADPITQLTRAQLKRHFQKKWADVPDILEPKDIVQLTGYTPKTVCKWLHHKSLRFIHCPEGNIVAKECLIDYIADYAITKPIYLSDTLRAVTADLIQF